MRLLPKYDVDKKRAEEQRQKMEEGMVIAERVDTLRETLASEEVAFEKYRTVSLKEIQKEIHEATLKRDSIVGEVVTLEHRKMIAENPVDLTEARQKVASDKEFVLQKESELQEREQFVTSRERIVLSTSRDLLTREERLLNSEQYTEAKLFEVENANKRAKKLEKQAEIAKKEAENEINRRLLQVSVKEKEVQEMEFHVKSREKDLRNIQKELANERKLIIDRQGVLQREAEYLKHDKLSHITKRR